MLTTNTAAELFRHLSAEKAVLYRCIMDVFAAAKRQYRLQLRPDEVLAEANWSGSPPRLEEISSALAQLAEWGNLESQPDTARVSSLNDFYRARFLYRLSHGGEAVEAGLTVFFQTLYRRAELQTVALEDITSRLLALRQLIDDTTSPNGPDVAKVHEVLRDLVRVFEDLAENAQAFMAGVARSLELQQADANAVINYKRRLIDYLERFMGDLVRRSEAIAQLINTYPPASITSFCRLLSVRQPTRHRVIPKTRSTKKCVAGKDGESDGKDFKAGSCQRERSRLRRNCCAPGRGQRSPSCWAPSRP